MLARMMNATKLKVVSTPPIYAYQKMNVILSPVTALMAVFRQLWTVMTITSAQLTLVMMNMVVNMRRWTVMITMHVPQTIVTPTRDAFTLQM
jgi:hypothetical protein